MRLRCPEPPGCAESRHTCYAENRSGRKTERRHPIRRPHYVCEPDLTSRETTAQQVLAATAEFLFTPTMTAA